MQAEPRVAVYYAPLPQDPLTEAAAAWLGRDPESNAPVRQPDLAGLAEVTTEPRLYGFHATLKPPMALRDGADWDDVLHAANTVAAGTPAFDLPPLAVAELHGFLALRETEPCPALQALADACVEQLDWLRAPLSEAELTRRRKGKLTPEHDALLVRWGYPYVFGAWFFHMTLTRRLTVSERAVYHPAAERHFAAALAKHRRVTEICLFTQRMPGDAFVVAERLPLGAEHSQRRMSA